VAINYILNHLRKEEGNMGTKKLSDGPLIFMAAFMAVAFLFTPSTGPAAETVKYRVTAYLTDIGIVQVGDAEGHIVGHYTRRGLAFFEKGEVATYTHWGTFDFTKGVGPYVGYSIFAYEDGSTIVQKIQGPFEWEPGRKMRLFKGIGEFIRGTGRFEGIKGTVTFSGKEVTPYSKETKSDLYFDATAIYTLPSK
jgi:hypothetical protein